ncbi:hypothetical protein CCAX7_59940 [Capsulimonas corticalis]|uniref:Uncharacterized protein n=1 Tax=Capsulimonas corticalis TaxID=2219043 RepID=A0A402CZI1_9BACT|nr:hypothetical protein [Capsulimonas corticalis]BDI33943.1 hypothetical protein CCAX7_59940 [Capsulimonas corticalis]
MGNGIGVAMLRWAEHEVGQARRQYLRLDCLAANGALRDYYLRAGFTYVGEASSGDFHAALFEREIGKTTTMTIGFTAVERFGRGHAGWEGYEVFSGFHQVDELVTLDSPLCPNVLKSLIDEDWNHNLKYDGMPFCFHSLDYLLSRITLTSNCQVLAVMKNPIAQPNFHDPRFDFIGYDLVEEYVNISAITNCGGFDNAFRADELSIHGLIPTFDDAIRIDALLRQNNPDEPHAFCDMFAVWRMVSVA